MVDRLSAAFGLFYYLALAPNSTLKIAEFFTVSSFVGLHDRFNVAFGLLSFASLPEWTEGTSEDARLRQLRGTQPSLCDMTRSRLTHAILVLALDVIEEVSPSEFVDFERCFSMREDYGEESLGEITLGDSDDEAEMAAQVFM